MTSEKFINDIREIIDGARTQAVRSVDSCRVQMYWHMGKRIFEEEQQGKERADYGAYLIKIPGQTVGTRVWKRFFCPTVGALPPIL